MKHLLKSVLNIKKYKPDSWCMHLYTTANLIYSLFHNIYTLSPIIGDALCAAYNISWFHNILPVLAVCFLLCILFMMLLCNILWVLCSRTLCSLRGELNQLLGQLGGCLPASNAIASGPVSQGLLFFLFIWLQLLSTFSIWWLFAITFGFQNNGQVCVSTKLDKRHSCKNVSTLGFSSSSRSNIDSSTAKSDCSH